MRTRVAVLLVAAAIGAVWSCSAAAAVKQITWWAGAWNQDVARAIVEEFNRTHSDIRVQVEFFPWEGMFEKYLVSLVTGNAPDVMNVAVDWNVPFASTGRLLALDEYIARDLDEKDFLPNTWIKATFEGKRFGVPYRTETAALLYDKAAFRAAGLDPNRGPATWQELATYARRLTSAGRYGYGYPGKEPNNVTMNLITLMWCSGGDFVSKDLTRATVSEPKALRAAEFLSQLYFDGVVPSSTLENTGDDVRRLMANNRVAMTLTGSYDIDPIKAANPRAELGSALVPEWETRASLLAGWNVVITKQSKRPDAAWEFVKFFVMPENMARYTMTFPTRYSAAGFPRFQDPLLRPFLEQTRYARPLPNIPQLQQLRQIMYEEFQQVLLRRKSARDAMESAEVRMNEVLAR
ncbi:MAG: ABC transporter substrate-binding protein [Bacillota bacterium]